MSTLSGTFLDWWFAPWRLGGGDPVLAGVDAPPARRDAYRAWCRQAGVPPDLPAAGNPGWQAAALEDGAALRRCCALYGGLFAAREQDHAVLRSLPADDRRWCLSVAMTQPLQGGAVHAGGDAGQRGMLELACRLDAQFPGMWQRLRRLLHDVPATPSPPLSGAAASAAALSRAQRCWSLCLARAQAPT
ncbi:hypothetical protein [Duganella sp. LjRoot269]|uniref:hypothetical protein n=1 Tax=Duganella sp. LjRoot269 TaxID=3342305 RepID=UPI003ECC7722